MSAKRLNRPVMMADLLKDGGAIIGKPETMVCPACGAEPRLFEVVTPKKGWVLQFWIPPFGCCKLNRRGAV